MNNNLDTFYRKNDIGVNIEYTVIVETPEDLGDLDFAIKVLRF